MAIEAINSVLQQTHGFLKHYKLSNYTPILYTFAHNIFVFFLWKVLMRYIYRYLNNCCQLIWLLLHIQNSQFICKLCSFCLFFSCRVTYLHPLIWWPEISYVTGDNGLKTTKDSLCKILIDYKKRKLQAHDFYFTLELFMRPWNHRHRLDN